MTSGERLLFAHGQLYLEEILRLIEEYNGIAGTIRDLGFRSADEPSWPVPMLELTGNGCSTVDEADILDQYIRGGRQKKVTEIPMRRGGFDLVDQRQRLGSVSGWKCRYCSMIGDETKGPDGRVWHVDHIYPVARGGDAEPDNLALACATCNLAKKAALLQEFLTVRELELTPT